jgi:hypothetical protein
MSNAVYSDTYAWAPSVFNHPFDMPPRLRAAAERWQAGRLLHEIAVKNRRNQSGRLVAATYGKVPQRSGGVVPLPSVAAHGRPETYSGSVPQSVLDVLARGPINSVGAFPPDARASDYFQ